MRLSPAALKTLEQIAANPTKFGPYRGQKGFSQNSAHSLTCKGLLIVVNRPARVHYELTTEGRDALDAC